MAERGMHDGREDEPRCKQEYHLHTDLGVQQGHLMRRDGLGCVACGKIIGRWVRWLHLRESTLERWSQEQPDRWSRDIFAGEASMVSWETGLQVDHVIALSAAYPCYPDAFRRRWFFGPENLQLLCNECHVTKTGRDRALIRAIADHDPDWGREQITAMLAAAGKAPPPSRRPGRSF